MQEMNMGVVGLYSMFEDQRCGKPATKEWLRQEAQLN